MKFWKKEDEELFNSPYETMGFSREENPLKISSILQKFLIKMYDLKSLTQVEDMKKQLLNRRILIVNTRDILESGKLSREEFRQSIVEIKEFLSRFGGSLGRIGNNYLIITPNSSVKIAN
ncbi:MAG: DUF552 domain-containing protein [Candidatus Lokiarchaeota archaeon]|nr:DUF552 domain-containing protein [Candidatus Lokiarchaeota archaeon]MBD3342437.1 DUF552 domain-containing protein [Candidatus Lokiarchaeota archaeon]